MIVVDIETTGLDSRKNSIVSIGAVDFSNPNPENNFYVECRIWGGAEINQQALDINGFTIERITDSTKKSLEQAVRDFISWTENSPDITLAGENPSFDRDFLMVSAERSGIKWIFGYRTIDLHTTCRNHYERGLLNPPKKNRRTDLNLDKILEYVGLPEEPKPHNALTGAKMEAEAFSRLLYRKNLLLEFKDYPLHDYLLI